MKKRKRLVPNLTSHLIVLIGVIALFVVLFTLGENGTFNFYQDITDKQTAPKIIFISVQCCLACAVIMWTINLGFYLYNSKKRDVEFKMDKHRFQRNINIVFFTVIALVIAASVLYLMENIFLADLLNKDIIALKRQWKTTLIKIFAPAFAFMLLEAFIQVFLIPSKNSSVPVWKNSTWRRGE